MTRWYQKERLNDFFRNFAIVLLIALFLVIALSRRMLIKVKPGEVGVLYSLVHGTLYDRTYGEGLHIISPVNTMYIYNTRIQKIERDQVILSFNGLRVNVKYSVLFRPDLNRLAVLHSKLGPDYPTSVVTPAAESWTRKLIANLTPEEIYLMDRGVREAIETDSLYSVLFKHNIIMEGYMISSIHLPDTIATAIERTYAEQQISEQYDYKLQVEQKERQRKTIEAQGISDFRTISNVEPELWKALDVTQKIGTAPNSKVIIMGNSSQQLPVLLNDKLFSNQ